MSKMQEMLEEAIEKFGLSDIATLRLSEKRDEEIAVEQKQIYRLYKEQSI
ncbi:hypothetical protein SDC9_57711 [bioreactor metagenome]|uniref:Uncharacterized protein n=1 Tax=bioreactor metagenome TaxID=1076179 RepID=A0A644X6C6_9ZZZZ